MAYQISDKCIACHCCEVECPAQAIRFEGTHYVVDADKCIGCGHCETVCNVGCICDPDRQTPPEKHERRELTADVVVLGGGASGLVAAVRAAEATKGRVLVLEKGPKPGGNAWFASCFMSFGTRWHEKAGVPDVREATVDYYNNMFKGEISPELIRRTVYATGEFFNWLEDICPEEVRENFRLGQDDTFFFLNPRPYTPIWGDRKYYSPKNRDFMIGPGKGGSYVIRQMLRQCEKYGVEILTNCRAVSLETHEDGSFRAVTAQDPGGETRVEARACILATGGWTRNDELISKYYPWFFGPEGSEPTHRFCIPTVEGDVIGLAESVGAQINEKSFWLNLFGPVHHPFCGTFVRFGMQPENVYVGQDGKRFFNEDNIFAAGVPMLKQPSRVVHAVVDADTLKLIGDRFIASADEVADGWLYKEYMVDVESEAAVGFAIKKADTLEELAERCGMDQETFLDTVRRYNTACETGVDEDFGKSPANMHKIEKAPFYAFFHKMATDGAFGGVRTDESLRVLRPDGSVIPGLYAAGDNNGSWGLRTEGEGDHRSFLLSELTWAVTSGFMAGAAAAECFR